MDTSSNVTELLAAWNAGDPVAEETLIGVVYSDLRRLAKIQLDKAGRQISWQPTELVHELYFRLEKGRPLRRFVDREHFFAVMSVFLRNLIVDRVRYRNRLKRSAEHGAVVSTLVDEASRFGAQLGPEVLLSIDESVTRLASARPRAARIVELRYFVGLTVEETAAVLGVDRSTVVRGWRLAKAWLRKDLTDAAELSSAAVDS